MKKKVLFLFVLMLLWTPSVKASEIFEDGWHIVVSNYESERNKPWAEQNKVWTYYESGKEIKRYYKLFSAHRGWGTAPENSLASFQEVLEHGFYSFETDVFFTKDNVAVLSHDEKINEIARNNDLSVISEDVFIGEKTYQELVNNYVFNIQRVNNAYSSPSVVEGYETNRITSFADMLDFVVKNKMFVVIELKKGTKQQIESLVKMTHDKKADNYVFWSSFYTDLLKYVRDYDDDEILGINMNTTCDGSHNMYCGEEVQYYVDKLKTDNNIIWLPYYDDFLLPYLGVPNLPADIASSNQAEVAVNTIPQGVITINESTLVIDNEIEKTISYEYTGDGVVKCNSSNINLIKCVVDNINKKITITSLKDGSAEANLTIYSSQGISTSATKDYILKVRVANDEEIAKRFIDNIKIKNYDFEFNKDTKLYKLKIGEENTLDVSVDFVGEDYSYVLEGNESLKKGSIVSIHIVRDNKKVLTYQVEIMKDDIISVPDTYESASKLSFVFGLLFCMIGFGIIIPSLLIHSKIKK